MSRTAAFRLLAQLCGDADNLHETFNLIVTQQRQDIVGAAVWSC